MEGCDVPVCSIWVVRLCTAIVIPLITVPVITDAPDCSGKHDYSMPFMTGPALRRDYSTENKSSWSSNHGVELSAPLPLAQAAVPGKRAAGEG
jgi:hypothetical protein